MLELASVIVLGIFAQWLAWKVQVPAILPLILIGLFLGPIYTLFPWAEGQKFIEPIFNEETQRGIFPPGQYLYYFVSLSIGIILFEGGLTLQRKEIKGVAAAIFPLITIGSVITFFGAGLAAHYIMGLVWPISFLFAGLIIVTGPTVIAPILRNVPVTRNIATVLKWEGILIDPIGALVAVLVFEFIHLGLDTASFQDHALVAFGKILVIGFLLGGAAAYFLAWLMKKELVPHYLLNVFILALVLGVFVGSDMLAHESGLLTVVVMGMALGNMDIHGLKEILYFKESISILLISVLFILLSANINLPDLTPVLDWRFLVLFLIVVFVLRPLGVFASTPLSALSTNEKLFISWVGPRGIVAAGIASLFGMKLMKHNVPQAEYITPMVFMIVLGTVLLNATTAKWVAGKLKVLQGASNGILIVGANTASKLIAKYLKENKRHCVIIDNNGQNIKKAEEEGLLAYQSNIYSDVLSDNLEMVDVGYVMAMTSSSDVNKYAVNKLGKEFGEEGAYRLITPDELRSKEVGSEGLFSPSDDFFNLGEVARDYPHFYEIAIDSKEHFEKMIEQLNSKIKSVPMFIKDKSGHLSILVSNYKNLEIEEGSQLVYMGQKFSFEEKA